MSKILNILKDFDTKEKIEYLLLKEDNDPFSKARCITLKEKLVKQAQEVLAGNCPHEREIIGNVWTERHPRDWFSYKESIVIYGKCKFCGK